METRLSRWLNGLKTTIDSAEAVFVDLVAAVVPWFAPVIPAYMAYHNMTAVLGFNRTIAFIGAMVIELLGLATVHTVFWLFDYNDTSRKSDQRDHGRAPVRVAVGMSAFYLVIVITVNVLLDGGSSVTIAAKTALTLISIPAAVTVAVRSQHKRRLVDVTASRAERGTEQQIAALKSKLSRAETARDTAVTERDNLVAERDALLSTRAEMVTTLDTLQMHKESLAKQRDTAVRERDALLSEVTTLRQQYATLPPVLAAYVEQVARGVVPDGDFTAEYGVGESSLKRANSIFLGRR